VSYLYNPPWIIKRLFGSFIWETCNNKILLTFDDGPNPGTTLKLLKLLDEQKIKALFFCLGENIVKYPELCKAIIEKGHTIGNHTYSHKKIKFLNGKEIDKEISKTSSLLEEKFNYQIKYFRPPYGRFTFCTSKMLEKHGMKNIMWSLLTWDYKGDFDVVKKSIIKCLKNNSIVVFHDSDKTKNILLESVNFIIEEVKKKNFIIGEPENCLR